MLQDTASSCLAHCKLYIDKWDVSIITSCSVLLNSSSLFLYYDEERARNSSKSVCVRGAKFPRIRAKIESAKTEAAGSSGTLFRALRTS